MSSLFSNGPVRLNRFLARCGIESRRQADVLISEGRVAINGAPVLTPGTTVQETDSVRVDGKIVMPKEECAILLHKPRGFVCSREAQGSDQKTIYELLLPRFHHLHYVGRLDNDSEGMLLLTNDGDLDQRLMRPAQAIEKEYWVTLDQAFDNGVLDQLLRGVTTKEGHAKAKATSRLSARRARIVLDQGIKRQIREMFACLGLRVTKLVRVRIGSLWLGDLEPGAYSVLTNEELAMALRNPATTEVAENKPAKFKPTRASEEATSRPTRSKSTKSEFFARGQSPDRFQKAPKDDEEENERPRPERRGFAREYDRESLGEGRSIFRATPQEDGEERRPRRDFGDRPERREGNFGDRPRRDFGERPARREFNGERPRRSFGDRPERGGDFRDRKPFNRDGENRRPFNREGDNRRPFNRTEGERKPFNRDAENRPAREPRPWDRRNRNDEHSSHEPRRSWSKESGFSSRPASGNFSGPRRNFDNRPSQGRRDDARPARREGGRPPFRGGNRNEGRDRGGFDRQRRSAW